MDSKTLLFLLVDPDQVDVLQRIAEIEGLAARPADDAGAAVEAALDARPLAFVTDLDVPGDAGLEACRAIRGREELAGLPILAFCSATSESTGLGVGVSAFLARPPSEDAVGHVVAAFRREPERAKELELAVARLRAGDATGSLDALHRLVATGAGEGIATWAQYFAGHAAHAAGDAQAALEELDALLAEAPSFWRARARLGSLFESAGDEKEAARHYRRALAARSDQHDLRERLDALTGRTSRVTPEVADDAAAPLALSEESDDVIDSAAVGDIGATAERREGAGSAATSPTASMSRAEGGADEPPTSGAESGSGATILIADDSELALSMVAETLRGAGYRVIEATDGKEALERARESRPDLVILDGLMPGKSGFEVCKELKEEVFPDNPPKVLIWSAVYTKQRQRTEAREEYKADDLLPKAADGGFGDSFLLTVERHLAGSA